MKWTSIVHPRDILLEFAKNQLLAFGPVRAARLRFFGRTARSANPVECAESAIASFQVLLDAIGGTSAIEGRDVLEIGPGDAVPFGVIALGAGARRYLALDRFIGNVSGERSTAIYEQLLSTMTPAARERVPALGSFPYGTEKASVIPEAIEQTSMKRVADVILSYNVLEHVFDMPAALRSMAALLRPGGIMVHRVDYSAHGPWQRYSNGLTFLTVPESIWKLMGTARGTPNRLRHGEVIAMMRQAGFDVKDHPLEHFRASDLEAIRPLLPDDRANRVDDVAAAIIVAQASVTGSTS
jgi:SAM-dependent methyltransferase